MRKKWNDNEIKLLYNLYPEKSREEIAINFPDRTWFAIALKAKKLKIRRTDEATSKSKSDANKGEKNSMWGKKSPRRGLNKTNSESIRKAAKKLSKTRKKLFEENLLPILKGDKNPMFGKIPWNKGKTKFDEKSIFDAAIRVSNTKKNNWKLKSEEEKVKIIDRLNSSMIKKRKPTSIEKIIQRFLEIQKIQFIKNYKMGNFLIDFYLPDYNLVIECDGDYWHCNPRFYSNPDKIQLKNKDRDKRKEELLVENNIKFVRYWEFDIKNNYDDVCNNILSLLVLPTI